MTGGGQLRPMLENLLKNRGRSSRKPAVCGGVITKAIIHVERRTRSLPREMDEKSASTWENASFSPIPRAYYHYKEKHIYKEKRAKNKKGIIPLAGMRLSKRPA